MPETVLETGGLPQEFVDNINYAIFFMGASNDDQFNENETRKHLFKLRELVEKINRESNSNES